MKAGQAGQTIERSRFVGNVIPAGTVQECESFFERVRKEHRQANHNVPAYVFGDDFQQQWASDDGEPRGTAGAPIVHMLVSEGISDVCIVVTRYFGGVKLGTGGLVRAYTGTAKLALAAAGLGRVSERLILVIEIDYAGYHRLEAAAGNAETYRIDGVVFTEKVTVSLSCDPDDRERVLYELRAVCPSAALASERKEVVTTPLLSAALNGEKRK